MWKDFIKEKFEEKFPTQFEGCRNNVFMFMQSDHSCVVYNSQIGATCSFKYLKENEYSLEIRVKPVKGRNRR